MKSILFLTLLALSLCVQAQEKAVPNEYILYLSDGTTPNEVTDIANTWNSSVLTNVQPGTNIVVFKFDGSYPFTNPYDQGEQIHNLFEVVGKIKRHQIQVDGGSFNYFVGQPIPGLGGSNCYDESLIESETGQASDVIAAIFDSGTNWEAANDNGFSFEVVHEMNGDASDKHGHGTHVASIVNGVYLDSNNGSTSTRVKYVFGNPLGITGTGTLANVVLSMEEAIIRGANVINCSFSLLAPTLQFGNTESPDPLDEGILRGEEDVLYLLMSSANPRTTLFVVSAGNNNLKDLDAPSSLNAYPAAFPLENMITVASYNCLHGISDFSNYGAESVDLAAPGEDIVSIDHEMNQVSYSGTSQAAAFVSGAATILGSHLASFDADRVKCAIMATAKNMPGLNGLLVTEGVLNIPEATNYLLSNGCDSPSLTRSIQSVQLTDNTFSISPNPTRSTIGVVFNLEADSPVHITSFSLSGQTIFTTTKSGSKGRNEFLINFDNFTTDNVLLIRIVTNEFAKTSKIIRVK